MTRRPACGTGIGLPAAALDEIHDCLVLALDASERRHGYTQLEREARSYMRHALRDTRRLLAEVRA